MGMTSKGRVGERGIADYINLWFPNHDQGYGAKIIPSNGQNDIGDIDGVPYTCIEAKNWKNPPVGTLLDNAEWKAGNAKRPIWFLAYKRKGFSQSRAGAWHALTTVEGFYNGIMPLWEGDPMSVDDVEELCRERYDFEGVRVGATYPGLVAPEHKWTPYLMFRNYYNPIESSREETLSKWEYQGIVPEHMHVPVIIHPRVGEPVNRWYVYTRLAGFVRILETMGIVPQDASEYEGDQAA